MKPEGLDEEGYSQDIIQSNIKKMQVFALECGVKH